MEVMKGYAGWVMFHEVAKKAGWPVVRTATALQELAAAGRVQVSGEMVKPVEVNP